jgi:hypothetical protein
MKSNHGSLFGPLVQSAVFEICTIDAKYTLNLGLEDNDNLSLGIQQERTAGLQ